MTLARARRNLQAADAHAASDPSQRVATLSICILGLTISSSWGNGHATVFRALTAALAARGHTVTFLEHDKPWYAAARDCPDPPGCTLHLYADQDQLERDHLRRIRDADVVLVGSYVPDGRAVIDLVQREAAGFSAFYDIDTPITLAALRDGTCEYLAAEQVAGFDAYFSFTGGRSLRILEDEYHAPVALPLYCAVDTDRYAPDPSVQRDLDLGYMGTYSDDRQPTVDSLLLTPARRLPDRRFALAGPMYPDTVQYPLNVERVEHLAPADHPRFYNRQRYTLNVTRQRMRELGHAPSVRLFEAAACGTPIISDTWPGLDELFEPSREILLAETTDDIIGYLRDVPDADRRAIGQAARQRVLTHHTAVHRAIEFEAAVVGSR